MELKQVLVVEAGMPSAVLPIVLARHYGGAPGTALRIALSTSLLALVTLPLWISFGLLLINYQEIGCETHRISCLLSRIRG
jgi:malate permease and related proteins